MGISLEFLDPSLVVISIVDSAGICQRMLIQLGKIALYLFRLLPEFPLLCGTSLLNLVSEANRRPLGSRNWNLQTMVSGFFKFRTTGGFGRLSTHKTSPSCLSDYGRILEETAKKVVVSVSV
jgi:hypothetical protein